MSCGQLCLLGQVLDNAAELVSLLGGSSASSQSALDELKGSLLDLADSGLEHFEDSLFEASHAGDGLNEFADRTDALAGSALSVDRSVLLLHLGDDEALVEADCEAVGQLSLCHVQFIIRAEQLIGLK